MPAPPSGTDHAGRPPQRRRSWRRSVDPRRAGAPRWHAESRGEGGQVLVVALVVAIVVVMLSLSAVTQSVDTIGQAAVAGKQVTSTDASEAGISAELTALDAAAKDPSATSFSCPSGATLSSLGFGATYTLSYAATSGQTAPSVSSLEPCTGTVPLSPDTSYLFSSKGDTSAQVTGSHTTLADFYVPSGVTYGADTGDYGEALFAATGANASGGISLTGGDTYSGGAVGCNTGDTFDGNYFSSGYDPSTGTTTTSELSGACAITGNVTVNGNVDLTSGSSVGGDVVATGTVAYSGGAAVGGYVEAEGAVTISDGTIDGAVTSGSTVTISGGPTIKGNIYAAGNVDISDGTIDGTIYAGGTVTVTGSPTISGDIYSGASVDGPGGISVDGGTYQALNAYDGDITYTKHYGKATSAAVSSHSYTITPACDSSYGPSTCSYSLANPTSDFVTPSSVTSAVQAHIAEVSSSVDGAYTTDGTPSSNPTSYASGGSYPFPQLDAGFSTTNTTEVGAWLADTAFCTAATATAPCVESTGGTSLGSYCNVAYPGTPANAECVISDNDCSVSPSDTGSVWALVRNMETDLPFPPLPTVLETDCPFTEVQAYDQNVGGSYSAALYNNLAVIDTAGFDFNTSWGGFSSGTGKTIQLFLIVPWGTAAGSSPSGSATTAGTTDSCALSSSDTGPDIDVASALTDSSHEVEDFLYTPYDICTSGDTSINGRAYAGMGFSAGGTLDLTAADIVPWGVQSSGSGSGSGSGSSTSVVGTPELRCVLGDNASTSSTLPAACNLPPQPSGG